MAPRFPRRRRADDEEPDEDPDDTVDLADAAHMWWAEREAKELWRPKDRSGPVGPAPERDVMAEHFGADWRNSFGFDRPSEPPPDYPDPAIDGPEPPKPPEPPQPPRPPRPPDGAGPGDPYAVLEIPSTATWAEIVDAHRQLARTHHPDRLVDAGEQDRAAAEDRIRDINAAYAELRIRRGK